MEQIASNLLPKRVQRSAICGVVCGYAHGGSRRSRGTQTDEYIHSFHSKVEPQLTPKLLDNCSKITDVAVEMVLETCQEHLNIFIVHSCPLTTERSLTALQKFWCQRKTNAVKQVTWTTYWWQIHVVHFLNIYYHVRFTNLPWSSKSPCSYGRLTIVFKQIHVRSRDQLVSVNAKLDH